MERSLVLLATQRALLGAITPNMKAITIDYNSSSYVLRIYFSSQPSEEEVELLKEITSEVSADIPSIETFKEEAIVTKEQSNKLERLKEWVYMQYYSPI
ncbi:MAG: hypothetical protein AAFW89_13700 [Bacteroidota bacterium]